MRAVPESNANAFSPFADLARAECGQTITRDGFAVLVGGNTCRLTFFSITEVPTPAVSATSSMASKSMSKLTRVPLAKLAEKRSTVPEASAASASALVKVCVKVCVPSVIVKVLSLPVPPDSLIEMLSKLNADLEAKPVISTLLIPRSRSAFAMSLELPVIAPSPTTEMA